MRAAREAILDLESSGLTTPERANQALERLTETTDLDSAAAAVDLVVESGPEDMGFKQDMFAHLDQAARPDAVLATNTSGLSITAIASKCARPERVITTHFWNPPHLMPLVEVVKGERTSDDVAHSVRDFLRGCGKIAVLVNRDRPGQLGNRLQGALQREAMYIVQEGIASVEDVDLAARCGFGLRLPAYGIFEHIDLVGLDLQFAVSDYVSRDLCDCQRRAASPARADPKRRTRRNKRSRLLRLVEERLKRSETAA